MSGKEPIKPMKCCMCGDNIRIQKSGFREGHNAEPIKKGRCCDDCNCDVLEARLLQIFPPEAEA